MDEKKNGIDCVAKMVDQSFETSKDIFDIYIFNLIVQAMRILAISFDMFDQVLALTQNQHSGKVSNRLSNSPFMHVRIT